MNSKLLHTPEGVRDLYGNDLKKKLEIEETIRKVFEEKGYNEIQTPTFEYFDIFSSDIGTTPSNDLYKFNDPEGNTLVLRPDFTPSIARCCAKYFSDENDGPMRFCYLGNTFANTSSLQGKLKEVTQMGAELMNVSSVESDAEVISLLIDVLKSTGLVDFQISIGNVEYFKGLCEEVSLSKDIELKLRDYISGKNVFGAENYLISQNVDSNDIKKLMSVNEAFGDVSEIKKLKTINENNLRCLNAISRLEEIYDILKSKNLEQYITFDLGLLSKYNYYTGVVFNAYTYEIGGAIAKGGRYDNLLSSFGKDAPAIGFGIVIDDLLNALNNQNTDIKKEDRYLTFALGKGRLANKTMELLGQMGIFCDEMLDKNTRKLIFVNEEHKLKFFLAKGPDVPTYVEYGAADIGVAGKDILLEYRPDIYELVDLKIGKCRMTVSAKKDFQDTGTEVLRVATKFTEIAKEYYQSIGRKIDIIHLNGSIELAPMLGLSDVIVDIVETGKTLEENNLEVKETIAPISARLVGNKSAYQFKYKQINEIVNALTEMVE